MLEFFTLKPKTFGLDISDLSLKMIQLGGKKNFLRLASFGETEIKEGIVQEGEIKDQDALSKIIKESLRNVRGERISTKYVVASLPEDKAFLKVIQLPRMGEEDLKSAILFEAENYIPFPIEEVYLDFQIVKPIVDHLDHFDVLIAALPKKIIDPYVFSIKKAGLFPVALEIESQAVARAIIKKEVSLKPVLIVDLGAVRTNLIVHSGYSLRVTFLNPISAKGFTEMISKTLGVSFAQAEKLKLKYGIDSTQQEGKKVFEALIPPLTDLMEQIKKYLNYYQTHTFHEHLSESQGVEQILLSGGGANLKGLKQFLSKELKMRVETGNPWVNILSDVPREIPSLSFEKSLEYTTAIGLALRQETIKNDSI